MRFGHILRAGLLLLATALPAAAQISASGPWQPINPNGGTVGLTASTVSGNVALATASSVGSSPAPIAYVCNTGANTAYITLSNNSSVVAVVPSGGTAGGYPVIGNTCYIANSYQQSYLAAITAANTTTLVISSGSGNPVNTGTLGQTFGAALPLSVANGGFGTTTLTAHGVLTGEGSSPVAATAAGATGNVLIGQGASADPVYSASLLAPVVTSSVNAINAAGGTTGNPAILSIAGPTADANAVLLIESNPTGTGGVFIGGQSSTINAGLQVANPTGTIINQWIVTPTVTGSAPTLLTGGASKDATVGAVFGTGGTGTISFDTNATEVQLQVLRTASAVNNLTVTGSTGTAVVPISAAGSGATIPIGLFPKGASLVALSGTTVANASAQVNTVASSVDFLSVSGAATANPGLVLLSMTGTDTNVGADIQTKGTGPVYLGGSTTGNAGAQVVTVASAVNNWVLTPAATAGAPTLLAGGSGADGAEAAVFGTGGTGNISFDTSGTTEVEFQVLRTASAVNNLTVTGSTGTAVVPISVTGTGATIPIGLFPKGASLVALAGTTVANASEQVNTLASSVDFLSVTGATTANPGLVLVSGTGTDTNVGLELETKGTGPVYLAGSTVATAGAEVLAVASSVNNWILTPAATGSAPTLLAGGSTADAAEGAIFGTGGTGNIQFTTSGTTETAMQISRVASSAVYVTVVPAAAGADPRIGVSAQNLILGTGAQILQNATTGYVLITGTATGKPTGVPVGQGTGAVPITVDPTPEICAYIAGAWKCAALS